MLYQYSQLVLSKKKLFTISVEIFALFLVKTDLHKNR